MTTSASPNRSKKASAQASKKPSKQSSEQPSKKPSRKPSAGPSSQTRITPGNAARTAVANPTSSQPVLLSGGNPQIPKGYGDAPVQAYIAAMPGWKSALGQRLDAIIERVVPNVRKAVKWNSPFYGVADESQGWFLSVHVYTKYVQIAFLNGTSLQPPPPKPSKHERVRYLDIHEDDFDEAQFTNWVKQASKLPGERM